MFKDEKPLGVKVAISATVVAIIAALGILIVIGISDKDQAPGEGGGDGEVAFDVDLIPTYLALSDVMEKAVEDIYGGDLEKTLTTGSSEKFKIPNTEVTFNKSEVGDNVDAMVFTAMAFKRNPYIQKDDHPIPLKQYDLGEQGSVRTLPDGTSIDLAGLVQDYSGVKLFISRNNPAHYTVNGYCNGDYFEDSVDLMELYAYYYEK